MAAVFLKLLDMSISASVATVAVILIKLLLKKAPRWIHCLMWALVAVRLICPYAIESGLSLMPDNKAAYEAVVSNEDVYRGEEQQSNVPLLPTYAPSLPTVNVPQNGNEPTTNVKLPTTQTVDKLSFIEIVTVVWVAGAILMAAYGIGSYIRLRRKVSPSIPIGDKLYICDYINSPFILGILQPRIYIPSSLSEKETECVVAHERAHIGRRDHWWKPIGYAVLAVYWFNPVIWIAYILLCRDIELACDERVISKMSTDDKKEYTAVLLSCSIPRRMISACPLAFGEVSVKWRIKNVLSYKKPTILIILAAVIAVTVASVCLLTDPVSAHENNDENDYNAGEAVDAVVPEQEIDDTVVFEPQLLTEVYYDIDGDGEEEYLVISDPTTMNNGFSDATRDISIYKNGYKTYYNIFIPYENVGEMYFVVTDDGLKIARQYMGEWEISDISADYLRKGRIVIEPSENIMIDGGMLGAYSTETRKRGIFYIDVAVIVDMGIENIVVGNGEGNELVYGDMEYIVVKPLVPGTQMFENWEAETFRFWISDEVTTDELQIGDTVKIVHNGGWGGSERELGPASGPVDISKMPSDALYVSGEAYIVCADKLEELKAELAILNDRYEDKNPR